MKGTVRKYETKAGIRWEFLVDLPRPKGAKRNRETGRGFLRKRDAEKAMAEVLAAAHQHTYVPPERQSFEWFCEKFWEDYALLNCGPITQNTYRAFIGQHFKPKLGHFPLGRITAADLQRYLNELSVSGRVDGRGGLSPQTVVHHKRLLQSMFARAVEWRLYPSNIAEKLKTPDVPKKDSKRILTPAQVAVLIDRTQGSVLLVAIVLAAMCGMRRGEILGLRWGDTNLPLTVEDLVPGRLYCVEVSQAITYTKETGIIVKRPKTPDSARKFVIPSRAAQFLVAYREAQRAMVAQLLEFPELQVKRKRRQGAEAEGTAVWVEHDLVCPRDDGFPRTPSSFSHLYQDMATQSGLPYHSLHDLRHCNATLQVLAGVDWKTISGRLGHSSVQITQDLYAHILDEMDETAARALDGVFGRQ